ncbi:MAG: glycosyltransferase [Archaeoglobaceae archaeon]
MAKVSIVIPVKNDAETLEKCLRSIRDLDFPMEDLEVIVVDGHSTDGSVEIAKRYGCKVFFEDMGRISYARDLGAKKASGEFIAFTDADCVVEKNWIKELLKQFDENVAAVGGPNLTPEDESEFGKAVGDVFEFLSKAGARYGFNANEVVEIYHNPTCNVMYRKKVLEEVGGFNHRLITVDDEELDYRIRKRGYKILFTPKAVVYHYRRRSWKSFAKMAYTYGIGRMQAIKLHREMGRWFHFVPMLTLFFVPSILLLSLLSSLFLLLAISSIILIALSISSASLYLFSKKKRNPLRYFGLISVWLIFYGFGMLVGLRK